ncbi:hypothetical protein BGZ54_010478 [Gamsiella multidivaricata]|nr:hypothetical protein BGZ54_010478 [Gamsiella multidivaricata]
MAKYSDNYCIDCRKLYRLLFKKHGRLVGTVSRLTFEVGAAKVRSLRFRHLPTIDYKTLIDLACVPGADDVSYNSRIDQILAEHSNEAADADAADNNLLTPPADGSEDEDEDDVLATAASAATPTTPPAPVDTVLSMPSSANEHLQVYLAQMKEIAARQAENATLMTDVLAKIAALNLS